MTTADSAGHGRHGRNDVAKTAEADQPSSEKAERSSIEKKLEAPDRARIHPTIQEIAERWAATTDPRRSWEGIAVDLVEALAHGEIGQTYTLEGHPADAYELYFDRAAQDLPVQGREVALDVAARVRLPPGTLDRWCNRPDFDGWRRARGLKRPSFLDELTSLSGHRTVGTISARSRCKQWLVGRMKSGDKDRAKAAYLSEAIAEFSGLTKRGFQETWNAAVEESGNVTWSKPGRLRKKQ